MEFEILAATLTTLAAVFAGLNGGAFTAQDLTNAEIPNAENTGNSIIPDIPFLNKLTQKPEPETPIKAEIKLPKNASIPVKQAKTKIQGMQKLKTQKLNLTSDQDITLTQFTGKITNTNQTKIKGKATGLKTSGVKQRQKLKINTETQTKQIQVTDTYRTQLKYQNASISPKENTDFAINTTQQKLNINSFTGNITLNLQNQQMSINGLVDKVNAGNNKYSGQN